MSETHPLRTLDAKLQELTADALVARILQKTADVVRELEGSEPPVH